MKLTFHGAARTVTGSQHLLEVNGKRILLDCGLYQGRRKDMMARNRKFSFDAKSLDAVILSHAHIDHSGNIPNLVKSGYKGDILCTPATRDLCGALLMDSGHIQEQNAIYANKFRRKGEPKAEPIYTQDDAQRSLRYFRGLDYHQRQEIVPGVTLTFIDAGHMLGSAMVVLDIREERQAHVKRLVYTGDIGREGIPIIRDPESPHHAHTLIMESTYGGRTHPTYPEAQKQLKRVIMETYERSGVVLIPAFAVGRTQQIVVQLNELVERGELPHIPVYVDSPLAMEATDVFRRHPECYDYALETMIYELNDDDPFGFKGLHYVQSADESKALNERRDPMIIISASGMIEFGRVVHHLKNRINEPRNTLLIVGWQAPHTLGRKLLDGAEYVRIFGHDNRVEMQVEVINGLSGHADHDEMLAWVGGLESIPRNTFLVHGEAESAAALAESLKERYPKMQVEIPDVNQVFEVK